MSEMDKLLTLCQQWAEMEEEVYVIAMLHTDNARVRLLLN